MQASVGSYEMSMKLCRTLSCLTEPKNHGHNSMFAICVTTAWAVNFIPRQMGVWKKEKRKQLHFRRSYWTICMHMMTAATSIEGAFTLCCCAWHTELKHTVSCITCNALKVGALCAVYFHNQKVVHWLNRLRNNKCFAGSHQHHKKSLHCWWENQNSLFCISCLMFVCRSTIPLLSF